MGRPYAVQYHPVFRTGLITAQNVTSGQVRVQFPDRDGVVSYWLPVIVPKTQNDKFFFMPDIGEQVVVLMDEHDEYGAVVGAIPSTVDAPPPGMTSDKFYAVFKDGTVIAYDRATHVLTAALGDGGSATLSTPLGNEVVLGSDGTLLLQDQKGAQVKLSNDGNVRVNGNLLVSGTIGTTSGTFGNGDMSITGTIAATGDITAGNGSQNISALNHVHSGVEVGAGNTAAPVGGT
ncbi:MAG TPA: phage baseplate assembly protein V [Acetobacteraceae bacterium]|nr:phage baseplate assembly protein V [Acetobacteraceae bacterium]